MADTIKLSSPWIIFYEKLGTLFQGDDEVTVAINNEESEIIIYVDGNPKKADALIKLLPTEKTFGNEKVKITVIPNNEYKNINTLFKAVFEGNKAISDIITITTETGTDITYVIFEKEVVHYWSDNIGDLHGVSSTLNQEIAKEVFDNIPGVFFCTKI